MFNHKNMAKKIKVKEEEIPTRPAWVVMQKGFEYDDNNYNQEEGGSAIKVYLAKERAEEAALQQSIGDLLGNNLSEYSWALRESEEAVENVKAAVKNAKGKYDADDDYNFRITHLPDNITAEQVSEILSALEITFYNVEEIELEMYIP